MKILLILFLISTHFSSAESAEEIARKVILSLPKGNSFETVGMTPATAEKRKQVALNDAKVALDRFMAGDKVPERVRIVYAVEILNDQLKKNVLDGSFNIDEKATLNMRKKVKKQIKLLEIRLVELMFPNFYSVKKGDSMWAIAQRFNVSLESLMKVNNNKDGLLELGQWLTIPQK